MSARDLANYGSRQHALQPRPQASPDAHRSLSVPLTSEHATTIDHQDGVGGRIRAQA